MTAVARPPTIRLALHRAAFGCGLAVVALVVALVGLDLRSWAWDQTEPIRFVQDINNAFRQGSRTADVGYVERYDNEAAAPFLRSWTQLDYGPGRLAVATLWAGWVRSHVPPPPYEVAHPATDQWRTEFYTYARQRHLTRQLCAPLLRLNLTGEALSAAAMFLLVRRFTSVGGTRPARGAVLGLISASVFWLDPALIWNAHCWPQWDSWLLPFLLWATLAAACDWWFAAGALIGLGAMFKGQTLFASVWFLLWPLFRLQWGAMARWCAGMATAVAAVTGVWAMRTPGRVVGFLYEPGHANPVAVRWVIDAAVAFVVIAVAVRGRATWARWITGGGWPRWLERDPSPGRVAGGVGLLIASLAVAAAGLAAAIVLTPASTAAGTASVAFAIVALVSAAWLAGCVPQRWVDAAADAPWVTSVAVRVILGGAGLAIVGLPLWRGGWAGGPRVVGSVVTLVAVLWWVPARSVGVVAAAWVAGAVLLCVPLFGGSGEWFHVGIATGTTARPGLSNGPNNNLPNLLEDVWGWRLEDPTVTLPPGPTADHVAAFLSTIDKHADGPPPPGTPVALPLKYLLVAIWSVMTAAAASGAARHGRDRDPRFLLAVAAPWVAMFAVMGQMHQRYLLWGAALTSMAVVVSPGLLVLHLLLSVLSATQEMNSMAGERYDGAAGWRAEHPGLLSLVHGWTPGMGWAVVTIAAVLVYLAAAPGRKSRGRRVRPQ